MIKYNLICDKCKFTFNSWFSASSEFDRLKKKKLITCTYCGSYKISKSIMSPNVSRIEQIDKIKKEVRKKILEYQKFIKENSTYVGKDFAYEARSKILANVSTIFLNKFLIIKNFFSYFFFNFNFIFINLFNPRNIR